MAGFRLFEVYCVKNKPQKVERSVSKIVFSLEMKNDISKRQKDENKFFGFFCKIGYTAYSLRKSMRAALNSAGNSSFGTWPQLISKNTV